MRRKARRAIVQLNDSTQARRWCGSAATIGPDRSNRVHGESRVSGSDRGFIEETGLDKVLLARANSILNTERNRATKLVNTMSELSSISYGYRKAEKNKLTRH